MIEWGKLLHLTIVRSLTLIINRIPSDQDDRPYYREIMADSSTGTLDDIDHQILAELQRDGRISIPALAEKVGIARATAYARFDRLQQSGVISKFTAVIEPEAVGLGVCALLMVSARQGAWHEVSARLSALPGVEWVGLCTGAFDYVLRVRVTDLKALRTLVLDQIQAMPEVRNSQTILVLDEV
jgi:DNA-binding Lrp family transcriptional regulator